MGDAELTQILLDWSSTFMRLSLQDFHHYARTTGLSLVQMSVLMHLYYRGPNVVTDFCEMMQISPAAASQLIERMVQQGFVQRAETPGDRRVRLVSLTDQGRRIVEESITARQGWIDQLVKELPAEEQAQMTEALKRLNEAAGQLEIRPVK